MTRVTSKNLLNFRLTGQAEGAQSQTEAMLRTLMNSGKPAEIYAAIEALADQLDDPAAAQQFVGMNRANNEGMAMMLGSFPAFVEAVAQCDCSVIKVPTSHAGAYDVPVEVYRPKSLASSGAAAYVYAHGGGCISGTAEHSRPFLAHLATTCGLVIFNVDYRLAPETKCPDNVLDFYSCIKYVAANAGALGVDPAKICVAGESGGGYLCLGSCVLLAQRGESHLVKLALPAITMVDDYCFSDPASMTQEERSVHLVLRGLWRQIARDRAAQREDPLLYPGKASEEVLEKFPPTVILEGEFDMFLTEATRFATRLRRVGRLLEFAVFPGVSHAGFIFPAFKTGELYTNSMKTIFKEYLF